MQHNTIGINPLLGSSPSGTASFRPVPIDWDVRYPPRHTARVAGHAIRDQQLTQLATIPAITNLHVISDLLMEDWDISVFNPNGVTVGDILTEVHRVLRVPLTQPEWGCISPMQQARIESVFYARCEASRDFDRTRLDGVRRIDCLLHTTRFAGLSSLMFRNNRWEVVLTLSRDFGTHSRAGNRTRL